MGQWLINFLYVMSSVFFTLQVITTTVGAAKKTNKKISSSLSLSLPNLVYILNDDTDLLLGSADHLRQTKTLLTTESGTEFTQFRTLSPKCTPSRTGQLAGRHYHNVRPHPTGGPGLNQTTMFDQDSLFPQLHAAGYWTSIVGKVHNGQAHWLCDNNKENNITFPFTHIATLCRPCGNYWGNEYVVKHIGDETTSMEEPLDPQAWSTYSHAQFGNRSVQFMRAAVKAGNPFFAYVGTTGPHLPAIPAPWHADTVRSWTNNTFAPRTMNFNFHVKDGHPTLAEMPQIDDDKLDIVDQDYRDRLGTLLSIDDMVANIMSALEDMGVLNNTWIIFSSDHGYHLGQWRIPMEKMWPFETDQRIPFFIRGPGIATGTKLDVMGVNMDIAPTLLDIAGLPVPSTMDGKSLLPLLRGSKEEIRSSRENWRTRTVISFAEGVDQWWGSTTMSTMGNAAGTAVDPQATMNPPDKSHSGVRYSFDNPLNQWRSLRVANSTHNVSFVEWDPKFEFKDIAFSALFDINVDPFQMKNLWTNLTDAEKESWHSELKAEFSCKGVTCH